MANSDTVRLLRKCEAGLKMGEASLDGVMKYTEDRGLTSRLREGRREHDALLSEVEKALAAEGAPGKDPSIMAKSMSFLQTNMKLAMDSSDGAAAGLVYDGCVMGLKNLQKYKNEYIGASATAAGLCDRAMRLEAGMAEDMKRYL